MPKPSRNLPSAASGGIDLQKISIGQLASCIRRLTLGSTIWLATGFLGCLGGTWALATASTPGAATATDPCRVLPDHGGLTAVRPRMSNEDLRVFLGTATRELQVVVPWFIDPLAVREAMRGVLANPRARVTIYFLDPKSPHLAERGRVARPDTPNYGPIETSRSLLLLAPEFAKAAAHAEIRVYDSIPPAFLVRADDRALLGFHMHTAVAIANPVLHFDMRDAKGQPTAMGAMLDAEVAQLQQISRRVDVRSIQERGGLAEFDVR